MSSIIKILPDHVINKIAAGEVVERPASVVKELIENSIDAGANAIFVDIEQAGTRLIRVYDNGSGMSKGDARTAFARHATSKITTDGDLERIRTMGFRGEALSSIASVSRIRMVTAERGAISGTLIEIEGGEVKNLSDAAARPGTSLEINDLFYNTPARHKFLKSPATELAHILTAVSRQAMAHPSLRFKLTHNKKTVLDLPASQSLKERAFQLYGIEIAQNLIEFSGERDPVRIEGLLGVGGYSRGDKNYQDFYVNRRAVRNASLSHALYAAYADALMRDRHPVGFIFIDIDPGFVDVNVHPAKTEVRFRNQSQIHDLVRDIVREGVRRAGTPSAAVTTGSDRTEGVKEATSKYFESAERGMQNAELKSGYAQLPGATDSFGADTSQYALYDSSPNSALGTPDSELLFPLAQIHDSFIIAQSVSGMAIIDQHAAHERVLFEKLQDQFKSEQVSVQHLLMPVQVDLGPAQIALLTEHLASLNRAGFIVEDFGIGTFMIKAVPSLIAGADYNQLLHDILDQVYVNGKSGKMEELDREILSLMACHPAIKIHRKLARQEMEGLLSDLSLCRMPHTCPHGRPTVIRFSLEEIKKMFKRM